MQICVLQHLDEEGPGHIQAWADARGHHLTVYRPDHGALPAASEVDALLVLGGPFPLIGAATPAWVRPEQALVQSLLQQGVVPLFGICLGAQIIAEQMGAQLSMMAQPELGWQPVTFFSESAPQPHIVNMLQWHDDAFSLPPGTVQTASTAAWPIQGYASTTPGPGRIIGVQFHPEWDGAIVTALRHRFGAEADFLAPGADDAAHFLAARAWLDAQLDAWLGSTPIVCRSPA